MSLEIQFLGLNLVYDGSHIYDAKDFDGGSGDPDLADPLTRMNFLVDGETVGVLTDDIWADVRIAVEDIPAAGGIAMGSNDNTFGFDLFTSDAGLGLALLLDEFSVFYTGAEIAFAGGGLASSVLDQDLPFGLEIREFENITVAFSSANISNITDDGEHLTGFTTSGTGDVKGVLVPEPSSALMLLVAGLGLVGVGRSRG